jgi:argininosuccinate lyase
MSADKEVGLRERVKRPPSAALVDSYYRPSVARALDRVFAHEMRIHQAHALMLARQGIVSRADVARILEAIAALGEAGSEALAVDYTQEDLYSYVERWIVGRLGPEVGGRLHTGRSRNDLNVTSWRMALREALLGVLDGLLALRAAALRLASAHADTVMPGYTHSQHAQPITLGYYLLTVADLLARDHRRLAAALAEVDHCPLGAGALSTTAFPIDREWTARALGFAGLVEVAYDAVSCRDDGHEAVNALALAMTNLSRLAVDLQAWNTAEYRFIELADQHSSVSSIMPQKKNPQALEHVKAQGAMVLGAAVAALSASRNTSLSDVNDGVTALNEPVLDAAARTRRALVLMAEVLDALTVHPETMRRSAELGFGTATELADVIVRETGLSFRMAHNVVAVVVRDAIAAGRTAMDIRAGDLDDAGTALFGRTLGVSEAALAAALDPVENIRIRTVTGGPAPAMVREMVKRRTAAMAADQAAVRAVTARLDAACATLDGEAAAAVRGATGAP